MNKTELEKYLLGAHNETVPQPLTPVIVKTAVGYSRGFVPKTALMTEADFYTRIAFADDDGHIRYSDLWLDVGYGKAFVLAGCKRIYVAEVWEVETDD